MPDEVSIIDPAPDRSARAFLRHLDDWDAWLVEQFGPEADFFPVDLDAVIAGDLTPPEPGFLRRSDGHHLLYPGKLHWLASEPEAGKSWLALLAVRELVRSGRKVVYFDYEMSARDIVRRLLSMDTLPRDIRNNLTYIHPPSRMSDDILKFYGTSEEHAPAMFEDVALVVFDACTEAMAADGLDPLSNTEVAEWLQRAPRLALKFGAAVLILDHVPKSFEGRGRYALGAQHKLAQTDVQYSLHNTQPFAPGKVGLSAISVQKDRPGGVREFALDKRVGTFVLNAKTDHLEAFVAAPTVEDEGPTQRMHEILEFARGSVEPLTKNQLESVGGGRTTTNRGAVTRLIANGSLIQFPEDVTRGRAHPRYVAAPDPAEAPAPKKPTVKKAVVRKATARKKTVARKPAARKKTTIRKPPAGKKPAAKKATARKKTSTKRKRK